jgi:hypothetical protein
VTDPALLWTDRRRALSFGARAELYDRVRPVYPPQALTYRAATEPIGWLMSVPAPANSPRCSPPGDWTSTPSSPTPACGPCLPPGYRECGCTRGAASAGRERRRGGLRPGLALGRRRRRRARSRPGAPPGRGPGPAVELRTGHDRHPSSSPRIWRHTTHGNRRRRHSPANSSTGMPGTIPPRWAGDGLGQASFV